MREQSQKVVGLPQNLVTSSGLAEASMFPSNLNRTSKGCSLQSKVCVTTTLAKQTLSWTYIHQN